MKRQKPSARERALTILGERGPMHYRDLADAILATGYKPRGKTFSQTLSAMLARDDAFDRVAPGVYTKGDTDA